SILLLVQSEVASVLQGKLMLVAGLCLGAFGMCALGVMDDTRGVKASRKFVIQIACASVAYFSGFKIQAISLPLLGDLNMGMFAFPVTVLWIVGITNAVNLIDGLDGLAAGVVFCAAGTNLVVAVSHNAVLIAVIMA